MVTKTKTPASRKAAASTAAQKKPAPRAPKAASPSRAAGAALDESLRGITQALEGLKLSGAAGTLLEGRRKDLQALVQANKKAYDGLQSVVTRQTSMLKDAIAQWQSMAGGLSVGEPRENLAKFDELSRQTFNMALSNIRELAELSAQSQAEAFKVVQQRIEQNVDEVRKLLQRG